MEKYSASIFDKENGVVPVKYLQNKERLSCLCFFDVMRRSKNFHRRNLLVQISGLRATSAFCSDMSLDDTNDKRQTPPIPKATDLLTSQPLPAPNGITFTTIPPSLQVAETDYEAETVRGGRAGLNTVPRLITMTGIGSFWGFALGAYLGGRQSGLQYLAENAHRLPTTVQGWYFYHKTKNYRVALGGIKRGVRYAFRTGGLCFVYGALEAGLDDVRGEADLFNSIVAGVGSGALFSALSKYMFL